MVQRALIGAVAALAIALAARRTRSLSVSGALAATILGTLAAAAGWGWAALLIVYFVSSTALSHLGRVEKERRTSSIVGKGGERDAVQVAANGGAFAVAALLAVLQPDARWVALGIGSLAASAADTWATEIGILFGGRPRSILTFEPLAPGLSGGITAIGTLASAAGASFIVAAALALGLMTNPAIAAALGGFGGALVDSLLGAVAQERRWCAACRSVTERAMHDCGCVTTRQRGLSWMTNDVVNFISAAAGGLLATWMAR
jgi:uncharacterized protein (TIGR00297 family)